MEHGRDYSFKIILMGDTAVGKSLLSRFTRNESCLVESRSRSFVNSATRTLQFEGKTVKARIFDTTAEGLYRAIIRDDYFRAVQGALVVYDVTRPVTFRNVGHWLKELRYLADSNTVIMLIGNKTDLDYLRGVTTVDGEHFAGRGGFLFQDSFALEAINVEQALQSLIREMCRINKHGKGTSKGKEEDKNNSKESISAGGNGAVCAKTPGIGSQTQKTQKR